MTTLEDTIEMTDMLIKARNLRNEYDKAYDACVQAMQVLNAENGSNDFHFVPEFIEALGRKADEYFCKYNQLYIEHHKNDLGIFDFYNKKGEDGLTDAERMQR